MPSIDGFPVPVAGRKITPGSTSAGPPQHAVDDQPVIHPPAATPRRPIRQQRLQPRQFLSGQIMTIKHDNVLPAHPLKIHETRLSRPVLTLPVVTLWPGWPLRLSGAIVHPDRGLPAALRTDCPRGRSKP